MILLSQMQCRLQTHHSDIDSENAKGLSVRALQGSRRLGGIDLGHLQRDCIKKIKKKNRKLRLVNNHLQRSPTITNCMQKTQKKRIKKLTLSNEVALVGVNPIDVLVQLHPLLIGGDDSGADKGGGEEDLSKHNTLRADLLGHGTGINAVDSRDVILLEPCAEGRCGEEVRVVMGVLADNKTSNMDLIGFEVLGEVLEEGIHGLTRRDTIVSDQREGQNENLTPVGGICQRLGVSDHT